MALGRLTLYRAITRLGRGNSLHLSDDKPALTFIQEPVLGARQRCGSPRCVGAKSAQIANRLDWLDAIQICIVSSADSFRVLAFTILVTCRRHYAPTE